MHVEWKKSNGGSMTTSKLKNIFAIALIALTTGIFAADKSNEDYIKDLKSSDTSVVIDAERYLGGEKVKEAVDPLLEVLANHENANVRAHAATALGRIEDKKAVKPLRMAVENDSSKDVVYSALVALLNLKDYENEHTIKALDYADAHHRDDPFIADVVDRLRKKIKK